MELIASSSWTGDAKYWQDHCTCQNFGSELFASADQAEIELAKVICRICPVSDHCLQYALESKESSGVWGGYSAEERYGQKALPFITAQPVEMANQAEAFFQALISYTETEHRLPSFTKGRVYLNDQGVSGHYYLEKKLDNWTTIKKILVLLCLRKHRVIKGYLPKARQSKQYGWGHATSIARMFGSYTRAVELTSNEPVKTAKQLSREQLLRNFARVSVKAGHVLRPHEVGNARISSQRTYYNRFGSYQELVIALQPYLPLHLKSQ